MKSGSGKIKASNLRSVKTFRTSILTACFMLGACNISFAVELDLQQSIDLAYSKNPAIINAQEKVNIASAKMGQAGSYLLPSLNLSASKGQNYVQPMVIQLPSQFGGGSITAGPDEAAKTSSYSLTAQQVLFAGGRVVTNMSIAKSQYDSAGQDLRKAQQDTSYNVTSAYFEVLKEKKYLEIMTNSVENLKRNSRITEVLYNSGIAPVSDLIRMKSAVANQEVMKMQVQMLYDLSKLSFQAAIGEKFAEDFDLKEEALPGVQGPVPALDSLLNKAYVSRPDFRSFEIGIDISRNVVAFSYGTYLPSILYQYSFGRSASEYQTNKTWSNDLANWRSMFVTQWEIFNGFNTQNKIREAYATLNSMKAQEQSVRDSVTIDVTASLLTLNSTIEKVKAARIASDLSDRALKSVEAAYKSNITTQQAYLDAQNAYSLSMLNYWAARYELEVSKARLNKSVGDKVI
ncbi:MAG: TolC family protein [Candidatus Saganbacteria bacterium]|nr:TolC family protein [Candidatus Saganbacteria bacterium]